MNTSISIKWLLAFLENLSLKTKKLLPKMLIWHVNTSRLSQITRQITEKSQIYKFLLCFLQIKKLLIKFNSNIIYFVFLNKPKKSDKKAVFKKICGTII